MDGVTTNYHKELYIEEHTLYYKNNESKIFTNGFIMCSYKSEYVSWISGADLYSKLEIFIDCVQTIAQFLFYHFSSTN